MHSKNLKNKNQPALLKNINPSLVIFSYKLIGAGFAFLVSILFLQFSNSEMLGKFALSITIITFLTTPVVFGQNVYLIRILTKKNTDNSDIYLEKVLIICLFTYTCIIPFIFGSIFFQFPQAVFFFILLFSYYTVSQLKSSLMLVAGRPILNSWYDDFLRPFWSILYIIIVMLLAYFNTDSEDVYLVASLIIAIPMCYAIISMARIFNINFVTLLKTIKIVSSDDIKKFFVRGWSVVAVAILGLLISQFDRVYVALILGYSVAGIYYAAQTLVSIINYFNQALISRHLTAMVSAYQHDEINKLEKLAKNNAQKSFLFSLLAIAGYIICYPLVKLIFNVTAPDFFWVTIVLLSMQSISLLFGFGSTMMLYSGEKGQRVLIRYHLAAFIVGTGLGSLFTFYFGIVGAAFGAGIGLILNRFLPFIYFRRLGYSLGIFGRSNVKNNH